MPFGNWGGESGLVRDGLFVCKAVHPVIRLHLALDELRGVVYTKECDFLVAELLCSCLELDEGESASLRDVMRNRVIDQE